ncbi:MAG: RNA-directed DNA polymerase [Terriglobales bacterium]
MALEDELILNAPIGSMYGLIREGLAWSQGTADISYQLPNRTNAVEWVKRGFPVWREWREKSLSAVTGDLTHVLFVDIANYYEHVDLRTLKSDLRQHRVEGEALDVLIDCLYRWADSRARGLPQGYSAADILAKVYLNTVDQTLQNEHYRCLRYVDDIRVFCTSELDARRVLLRITELLRARGLNVHSTKTKIVDREAGIREIDGITPVVEQVAGALIEEMRAAHADGYGTIAGLEALARSRPEDAPSEVLERAFVEFFFGGMAFDKTLFHFLLTRLAAVRSEIAVEYCLETLAARPDETESVMRYLGKFALTDEQHGRIFRYLASDSAIYGHQVFVVLRHYYDLRLFPCPCVDFARQCARDHNRPSWVRAYAVAILAEAGTAADLENLQAEYANTPDPLFRATLVCAVRRLERNRRNAWYGHVREDGEWQHRAVHWAQTEPAPPG